MSNLPQQNTINQYVANGSATVFNYSYLILLNTDIAVYITPPNTPPNPPADLQVLGVNYTVQNVGNLTGGTVTFISGTPASGSIITLARAMQETINTNFASATTITGSNLDNDFQRCMLVSQQIQSSFSQFGLQYAVDQYIPSATSNIVPSLANGQVWSGLNGGIVATTIETADVSLLRSQLASEAMGSDGASLVGYYNTTTSAMTTVDAALNALNAGGSSTLRAQLASQTMGSDGASLVGFYNSLTSTGQTVDAALTKLFTVPSVTVYLTGSGTYTTPVGAKYLEIKMVAGGGGGAGSGGPQTNGSDGTQTLFGSAFLVCNPGIGAIGGSPFVGGAGGTATGGDINFTGGYGQGATPATGVSGSMGGCSMLGGQGAGGSSADGTPGVTSPNSGSGGCGGAASGSEGAAAGGGAGGGLEKLIVSPVSTYTYQVGAGGAAGSAGSSGNAGGAGANGSIMIKAYFA